MMAIDSWADTLPDIIRGPLLLYKHRRRIQSLWKHLQAYLDVGATNIVVLGKSGAGKSVLSSHLHGEANSLDWVPPDVSAKVETKPISIGEWTHLVRVIPGQNSRERSLGMVEAFTSSDALTGVIYVASGGFIKVRDSSIASTLVNTDKIDTLEKFLTFQRRQEANDLREVCNRILECQAKGKGPSFLVVALNKCDLFLNSLDEMQALYGLNGTGEVSKVLQEFATAANSQDIRISVEPVCAWPEDFVWNNETLKTQITSIPQQKNAIRNFLNRLASTASRKT